MNGTALKVLLAACLLLCPVLAQAAVAEEELCARIRAFQAAPFEMDAEGKPVRRAIELHWVGRWMDFEHGFGKECHDGGTVPGKTLCAWLVKNTSTEFPGSTPMAILRCHGWKIPATANDWDVRKGAFEINTDKNGKRIEDGDRSLRLDIDMRTRKSGDVAIRLSVLPWAENFLGVEPWLKFKEPVDVVEEGQGP